MNKHKPIPADFPVQPLKPGENPKGKTTCGSCGLSWDDDQPTTYTPVPSGRCPFEAFHMYVSDMFGKTGVLSTLVQKYYEVKVPDPLEFVQKGRSTKMVTVKCIARIFFHKGKAPTLKLNGLNHAMYHMLLNQIPSEERTDDERLREVAKALRIVLKSIRTSIGMDIEEMPRPEYYRGKETPEELEDAMFEQGRYRR